jgi:phytanoyl-CoA hydroxylase
VLPPGSSRHPWNEGFAWSLPDTVPTTITPEQRAAFDRDGYLVLPDVVDAATLEDLVADLDAPEAQVDEFLAAQEDGRFDIAESGAITFTLHAVLRSEAARRFARHPGLVGLCHDLLGPDVNLYWDQAVYKKPEKPRRFPWHQDTGYTFVDPQHYLTCWVALTDATAENGCPRVLPAVHREGTLLHHWVDPIGWQCVEGDPGGAVTVEVPAGGVVAFSSLTPHSTGPNTTGSARKAYIVQYGPQGMRAVDGDWEHGGEPTGERSCDDPDRQFPVLRDGQPVSA